MQKKLLLCYVFLIVLAGIAKAQQPQTREDLQKQNQQIAKELADLNDELKHTRDNKKAALGAYAVIQRKIAVREGLINNINKELRLLEETSYQNELTIYRLKKELDTLKINYAKSIVFAYKSRSSYEYLNFLFSAESFNDALKRITYLKSYRQYRETQAETIVKTQALLQQKIGEFNNTKKEKSIVLQNQSSQLKVLEDDKEEKNQVVQQLKDQEKDLAEQIRTREKQRLDLKRAIDAAIRRAIEDEKKKEKERAAAAKQKAADDDKKRQQQAKDAAAARDIAKNNPPASKSPVDKQPDEPISGVATPKATSRDYSEFESTEEGLKKSLNFEINKGRLPWPLDVGTVFLEFGHNQLIPGTKLHVDEDGIDIKTNAGANVKCVADGEVTVVFNLDDYQAVVVRHGRYFTVYSRLESTNVSKGQAVKAGTILGKVAANTEGEGEFEFQVQNEKRQYQNPRIWLKRR